MNTNNYTPQPIDTSDVKLSAELMELAELMAENVHDVWAATRLAQGWTYGPERDDTEKKHPCLVPYDQLPEDEKVYDRNTSVETLKFIVKNGFDIVSRNIAMKREAVARKFENTMEKARNNDTTCNNEDVANLND